jgi:hypothetical protein
VTIERIRYFPGRLLGEADLAQEQLYLREKARRHNRMLHGWGVVSGLRVREGPGTEEITVEPGYALDPNGDEIVVADDVIVALCREDDDGNAVSPCPRPDRPQHLRRKRSPDEQLYVAIRYAECATAPVPAGESVEYSRTRESFAVKLLTKLPASYRRRRRRPEPETHPCPDAVAEPWVVLAEVVLDADSRVSSIDCDRHERRVATRPGRVQREVRFPS